MGKKPSKEKIGKFCKWCGRKIPPQKHKALCPGRLG